MKWMRERDALIAQTLAFVQSVTGRRDAGEPLPLVVPEAAPVPAPPPADNPSLAVAAVPEAPETADPPPAPSSSPPPSPVASEVQRELRARIANFRAHQERFNREREEYFSATLTRLRASMKDTPPPGPRR